MKKSMQGRIFYAIWIMTLAVMCISLVISIISIYQQLTKEQFEQLRNETELVIQGVSHGGLEYLQNLDTQNFRVTWINKEGEILYDSAADESGTEYNLEREEIQQVLEEGYSEKTILSPTLVTRRLYTAEKLPDGTVLRVSIRQSTIWRLLMIAAIPIMVVAALTLVVSRRLAVRLALNIMEPISKIDLNAPVNSIGEDTYMELVPLLTRLEEQRKQIIRDREELEKTSLIRQEFTANASHELKTPLHVISGYAELMEGGMVRDQDIKLFAAKIQKEAHRMTKLVEDIMDLTSLDSGTMDMKWEAVDLYRIALNAVDSLELEAEEAGILLSYRGDSAPMYGDAPILYSIVYNLCINAINYTDPGGKVWVEVRMRKKGVDSAMQGPHRANRHARLSGKAGGLNDAGTGNENDAGTVKEALAALDTDAVVLTVRDNGIGIPKEDLGRIFERFYRVDRSKTKDVGGTGLGLSIVKHAVMIHNADIFVESEVGKGTEFTVIFPVY